MPHRVDRDSLPDYEACGSDPFVAAAIADMPARQAQPRSRLVWTLASIVLFLICLTIFIWTGIRGLDFGLHWDERPSQIAPVKTMVQTEILLPQLYEYPSFDFWLNLAVAAPDALRAIRDVWPLPRGQRQTEVKARILTALDQPAYLLRARATYLLITALTILWVYLTVLDWGVPPMQSVFAAALLGSSWDIGYHSRLVATDGVLMQFAALTILLSSLAARRHHGERWLVPAAVAAGLGAGTKYTGGTLLLPVLIAAYTVRGRLPAGRSIVGTITTILVSFVTTFVATTPGAVLQPHLFVRHAYRMYRHYKFGPHLNYTVTRGLSHGLGILEYMGMVVFSHYAAFAAFFFMLAILGLYAIVHRSGLSATIVFGFPIVSLGFMSTQSVMIVRNDLAAVPAMAVLSSFGLGWLYQRLKLMPLRLSLVTVAMAGLIVNEGWLIWTSQTIVERRSDQFAKQAAAYVRSHPGTNFYLSPKVRSLLQSHRSGDMQNVVIDPARSTITLICAGENDRDRGWPVNVRGLFDGWFGPYEVNWAYYSSWAGDDRIIIIDTAHALGLGIIPG